MPGDEAIDKLRQRTEPLEEFWIKQDLVSSAPGPFNKAARVLLVLFLLIIFLAGGLFFVIYGATTGNSSVDLPFIIIGSVLLGCAVLFILYFAYLPLAMLLCNNPPVPEPTRPFAFPDTTTVVKHNTVYIVYNPTSGNGLSRQVLHKTILPQLDDQGIKHVICETNYGSHTRDYLYALPFTEEFTSVLVLGGDGSLFEAVNGMLARLDKKRLPIALFPTGSGNSFSSDLGHTNSQIVLDRFLEGHVQWCDAVRVRDLEALRWTTSSSAPAAAVLPSSESPPHDNSSAPPSIVVVDDDDNDTIADPRILPTAPTGLDVYSINVLSIGLIGDVGITAEKCRWLGMKRYDICGLWGILKSLYWPITATFLTADRRIISGSCSSLTTLVNNTQYMGRGHYISPRGQLDDGVSDVTLCKSASIGELLSIFLQLPHGSHVNADHHALMQFPVYSGLFIVYDTDGKHGNAYARLLKQFAKLYQSLRRRPPVKLSTPRANKTNSPSHASGRKTASANTLDIPSDPSVPPATSSSSTAATTTAPAATDNQANTKATNMPSFPSVKKSFPMQIYSSDSNDVTQLNDIIPMVDTPLEVLHDGFIQTATRIAHEITIPKARGYVNIDGEIFRYNGGLLFDTVPQAFQIFASPHAVPIRK